MFKERVIVEQNDKPKKKQNKNIMTLQPGHKQKNFEDLKLNRPLLKAVSDL